MWIMSPEEKMMNDNQFYMMNPTAGFLSGEQVKLFFLQSGLPQNVLGKIWQLSDLNADGKMDQREFSVAMHLIKRARQGYELPQSLPASLLTNMPMGSTFNPVINSSVVGGVYGVHAPPPSSGILYSSATLPYPGGSVAISTSDPRNFATMTKASVQAPGSGEWCITPGQRLRYKQMFNNHDSSHKGYLTGFEAKGILSQSGLTHAILAQIWSLADIDTDGNLSPDEFCVAMFLIDQAKSGFPIPAVLPPDLIPPSYRRLRRTSESIGAGVPINIQLSNSSLAVSGKLGSFNELPGNFNPLASAQNIPGFDPTLAGFQDLDNSKIITFEDKRKENFDKGQAELERRRAMLRDQQIQESEERLAAERAEQEKREKLRQDQDYKKQLEHERQLEKQRQIELEKEEQRRKALEQKEAARKEMERQRQLEWEKQRKDQLISDKNRELAVVDCLKKETRLQNIQLESLEIKKNECLSQMEESKVSISEMSTFIQSLKMSSLSKTTEIDVLKAELEEIEMKLVAAQQENLRLMKQRHTPDSFPDQGQQILILHHTSAKDRLDELKKKIEIIESTCRSKKNQISDLELKVEQIKKLCEEKREKNEIKQNGKVTDLNKFNNFAAHQPQKVAEEKKADQWGFDVFQNDSTSLFDSSVCWSDAFSSSDNKASAFTEVKPSSTADAWASFAEVPDTSKSDAWNADFNTYSTTITTEAQQNGTSHKFKALYRFDAKNPDELSLLEGDVVLVSDKDQIKAEPGWMIGSLDATRKGCFPEAYVVRFSEEIITSFDDNAPSALRQHGVNSCDNVSSSFDLVRNDAPSSSSSSVKSFQIPKKPIKVQALYQWQAKKDNHLSFAKGDTIAVLNQQEMWWFGEIDGRSGWFPKTYVEIVGAPEKSHPSTPPDVSTDPFEAGKYQQNVPTHPPPTGPPSELPERLKSVTDGDGELQNVKNPLLEEFIVVAMFTYSSNVPGDLNFKEGDVFSAQKTDEEWWTGTTNGQTGIFPASYVQKMETLANVV